MSNATATTDVVFLHAEDNICVAARNLSAGDSVTAGPYQVTLAEKVNLGHKIALTEIAKGDSVRKFGQVIGQATELIKTGTLVHSHNLAAGKLSLDYASATEIPAPPKALEGYTFEGIRRADGQVGTRNYLAIISTVNCSASVSKHIAHAVTPEMLAEFPNVDGVLPLTHTGGCGMQYAGPGHQMLNRVLGGMARHPNIGGYLLIGLGCEQGAMGYLLEDQHLVQIEGANGHASQAKINRPPVFSMQDCGGTEKTIEAGLKKVLEMLPEINQVQRETFPASKLKVGLECGGSDGNSGVTANPAVGIASDLIVAAGGTTILGEIPEIYGAEQLLTRRAVTTEVADKLLARIKWWEWYTGMFGAELDNNPSVGNKEGGLTTIYEKSLGAVAKAGSTALVDVYEYAEPVTAQGMVVMDTPGYDPASVTGMVAGGANMVLFTTGRGSCFGCKPVPSMKIATNTPMFERMQGDMDLDAGTILSGESIESVGKRIFAEILEVASGRKTCSEKLGYGEDEFVPWIVGPML